MLVGENHLPFGVDDQHPRRSRVDEGLDALLGGEASVQLLLHRLGRLTQLCRAFVDPLLQGVARFAQRAVAGLHLLDHLVEGCRQRRQLVCSAPLDPGVLAVFGDACAGVHQSPQRRGDRALQQQQQEHRYAAAHDQENGSLPQQLPPPRLQPAQV